MTTQQQDELDAQLFCNHVIENGAELMAATGAPLEMIINRMMSYVIAQIVFLEGAQKTARILRQLAKDIEAGRFDPVNGKGSRH